MKWFCIVPIFLAGCTSVKQEDNYGFFPPPGMQEDGQDRNNTKYNLLDSSDGSEDPNANIKIWKAEY